ncbi:MAG: tRNA threonylcarbamoyladenosine dehydratase [Muribaculaceae bacterium]|nr:tRNA threonylcarbamoyladenosine dehydratase [Muribaculaceae bacterium]
MSKDIFNPEVFQRTSLIAGAEMMDRMSRTSVIIFGVGGVGSWCAEALVRSGIGHLCIVDSDTVALSNINRQLMALNSTVGQPKVEVLRSRLRDINPACDITAIQAVYDSSTADRFELEKYDYVIDAIDSLSCKAHLILHATGLRGWKGRFFSSMGAALKLHADMIQTAEFYKVYGCPLARALRNRFKRLGQYPRHKFTCVFSPEVVKNRSESQDRANGTFAHTTAIFGLTLAGLVIQDLY